MTIRNLEYAVAPRSVAVVGASERAGSVGRVVLDNIVGGGFDGVVTITDNSVPGDTADVSVVDADLAGTGNAQLLAAPLDIVTRVARAALAAALPTVVALIGTKEHMAREITHTRFRTRRAR